MQRGHHRVAHFHRQIAARYHHAVGGVDNFIQCGDRLGAFDLGDQQTLAARFVHQIARPFHVVAGTRKGNAQIISLKLGGGFYVLLVLFSQRGCGQAAALAVDAFVVGERPAHFHHTVDARPLHRFHIEHDAPVVEQQRVAGAHILRQIGVIKTDLVLIAQFAFGIKHKLCALYKLNFVVLEFADTDFGTLQIHQHAHRTAGAARKPAHQLHARLVLGGSAVRKIHAYYVEARRDHAR